MNSGSATTTNANDLIFAAGASTHTVTAAGAGFTTRRSDFGNLTEDRVVTSAGAYNATATQNSPAWVMHMVAFRAAGGAPADTNAADGRRSPRHKTTRTRQRHRPGDRERERQRWRRGRPVPRRRRDHRSGGHEPALRAQLGHADGQQRRARADREGPGHGGQHDDVGARERQRRQHRLLPERDPRHRAWTSRRRSSSSRTGACSSPSCRARSRSCPRPTRSRIPVSSSRSPTSARPGCSRASTTSSSTPTSPPTTTTTSSTRSGRPTTIASRGSRPTPR